MVLIPIKCPHCEGTNVRKYGVSSTGKQRYICLATDCQKTFQDEYKNKAWEPRIRSEVYFLTINGNGIRAISRVLGIARDTVTAMLRSFESSLWYINHAYLEAKEQSGIKAEIVSGTETEMDEMWSFVHDKSQQYWLWWAIDHSTGEPLAFHFGTREHKNLDELLELLKPFNIDVIYSDDNQAYDIHVTDSWLVTGKENTQKIERKHLSLRTLCSRLVRKGIRFSKSHRMHRIVVALVINHWFFGRLLA